MSINKRPTTNARKESANAHNSTNTYGYAIIGDTVSSTLYAKRLLGNLVTTPITLINEGVDRTNIDKLANLDYAAANNKRILHTLTTEQLHMIPSGDNQTEKDDIINTQTEQVLHYHVGAGPLGDFISAYHIPRLGPWFTHSLNGRLERFMSEYTIRSPLNNEELTIANKLKAVWNLPLTSSTIVKAPAILNSHYEFIQIKEDVATRELFLETYHNNNQASNVDYITEVDNLKLTPGATGGLYDITYNSGTGLMNVKPIWRTNPFTYLRLATEAGIDAGILELPTFYRAVIPISINNSGTSGGIDLSNIATGEDLITTHLTFSLYDINNPKHSALVWLSQIYTAVEDLSVTDPAGKYADSGKTLLIIEALNTKNKRKASYNKSEHEIIINYNDRIAENGYLRQFAQVVSTIYQAYTGNSISVDTLLANASICDSGACHDGNNVVDYGLRESPMISILELASHMYGVDIYPSLGKHQ